jgi:hypothetical protein
MKLTPQLIKSAAKRYEQEFGVNPLQSTRLKYIVIPRQCLFLVLYRKYGIRHSQLADLLGYDRATAYHSIESAETQVKLNNIEYVQAVNRWASILPEFEEEMSRVDALQREMTTKEVIVNMLKTYPEEKAQEILNYVQEELNLQPND